MEAHPIPQDVTGFQFKLIGDMTVKQFAYIAGGIISAWIIFSLPVPIIIKLPFSLLFAGLGFCLAFVPIEGRPFDVMIASFAKALFTPNQYLFQKAGSPVIPSIQIEKFAIAQQRSSAISEEELQNILIKTTTKTKNALDDKETAFLQAVGNILTDPVKTPANNSSPISQPVKEEETEKILEEKAEHIKEEIEEVKKEEGSLDVNQRVLDLEEMLSETLLQKEELEQKLLSLEQQLPSKETSSASVDHVRKITKDMGKSAGLPISSDYPNLISGIVKDPRGNVLPNILIEVKDKEENPVRAFKTNRLGQFSSATPLLNGTYIITLEDTDEAHRFDSIELTAKGEVIPAIEIISHDAREDLKKFLFQ